MSVDFVATVVFLMPKEYGGLGSIRNGSTAVVYSTVVGGAGQTEGKRKSQAGKCRMAEVCGLQIFQFRGKSKSATFVGALLSSKKVQNRLSSTWFRGGLRLKSSRGVVEGGK